MGIENRRYIRFSLDVPAIKQKTDGEKDNIMIQQISVGGCLMDWDDSIFAGDELRLEFELPNKNFLPLTCKAIYRFENRGIGMKFADISQFEQELLGRVISERLENEGLPLMVDPFTQPPQFVTKESGNSERQRQEEIMEEAIASSNG